jgi:LysR family transcriptional regulator, pca operon transcriptional activator
MVVEVKDLELVMHVFRRGSVSGGATAAGITQPAASARLARLEAGLGARLFERRAQGVLPTAAGVAFIGYAERVLRLLDEAGREVPALDATARCRVAAPPSIAEALFPGVAAKLVDGGIRPELYVEHSQAVQEGLIDGRFDIGIRAMDAPAPPGFVERELPAIDIVCAAPPGAGLKGISSIKQLDGFPIAVFMWHQQQLNDLLERLRFSGIGAERIVYPRISPAQVLADLIAAGHCVGFVPRFVIAEAVRREKAEILRLRDMPRYQWQLVSLTGRHVAGLALEIVRAQFPTLCG